MGATTHEPRRLAMMKLESKLVPILLVVVIIVQLLAPYRGWKILITGLGGAFLLSWLWALSLRRGLDLSRQMRFGWAQVGDRLVERFTLHNEGWAPALWAEIHDSSTLPDYRVSRGTGVGGREIIRWHTEAVCMRRGLFTLGPTSLRSGDPFGIFSVSIDFPSSLPLLVLPPVVPLPDIQVAPGGRSGDARPRANVLDYSVSAASVREYVPGDSRRWIHWRTTARQRRLFVRQFDSTPAADWWILLDMDRHVQVGEGENTTDEYGVILAASLADLGIRRRRAVGLVAQGEDLVWIAPAEGEGQRWELLRALALVSRGSQSLEEVLGRVAPSIGRNASLLVVTPSTDARWVGRLLLLMRRDVVPTVLLLDPHSFGGAGDMGAVKTALQQLNVQHYVITRDVLDRPEARPGRRGHWEWRVSGTGKAIAVERDHGASRDRFAWRTLT